MYNLEIIPKGWYPWLTEIKRALFRLEVTLTMWNFPINKTTFLLSFSVEIICKSVKLSFVTCNLFYVFICKKKLNSMNNYVIELQYWICEAILYVYLKYRYFQSILYINILCMALFTLFMNCCWYYLCK